eukprot:5291_1
MAVVSVIVWIMQKILFIFYKLPMIGYYLDLLTLWLTGIVRLGCGVYMAPGVENCQRPTKLLKLYEYEGCPFCRKVRETLSVLDLDCIIIPCPRENMNSYGFIKESRYRNEVKQLGGKVQFPFLIDPNHLNNENEPLKMYESDKIIKYLWCKYGDKAKPTLIYKLCRIQLSMIPLFLVTGLRVFPEHGLMRIPSKNPEKPLELWSFEASPFCKKVREILSSLEIKYILRNVPRYSKPKRKEFNEKYGDMISKWRKNINFVQVPLLIDPNTNIVMLE